jgi:hypothetical protein
MSRECVRGAVATSFHRKIQVKSSKWRRLRLLNYSKHKQTFTFQTRNFFQQQARPNRSDSIFIHPAHSRHHRQLSLLQSASLRRRRVQYVFPAPESSLRIFVSPFFCILGLGFSQCALTSGLGLSFSLPVSLKPPAPFLARSQNSTPRRPPPPVRRGTPLL